MIGNPSSIFGRVKKIAGETALAAVLAAGPVVTTPVLANGPAMVSVQPGKFWQDFADGLVNVEEFKSVINDKKKLEDSLLTPNNCGHFWSVIDNDKTGVIFGELKKAGFFSDYNFLVKTISKNKDVFWNSLNLNENKKLFEELKAGNFFAKENLKEMVTETSFFWEILKNDKSGEFYNILLNANFFTDEEFLTKANPGKYAYDFWNIVADNTSLLNTLSQNGFFESVYFGLIIENAENNGFWRVMREKPEFRKFLFEKNFFSNNDLFINSLQGLAVQSLWTIVLADQAVFNTLLQNKLFENEQFINTFFKSKIEFLIPLMEKYKTAFLNPTLIQAILFGENEDYFWTNLINGKIPTSVKSIFLLPEYQNVLVNSFKKKILATARIWEDKSQNSDFAPIKRILHLAVDAILQDMKSGQPMYYNHNEWMRIINHFHHDSQHIYKGVPMRKYILDQMPLKTKFFIVKNGVSELYTSTSSFSDFIFPSIVKDIELSGGFKKYLDLVYVGEDSKTININEFFIAIARHNLFNKFDKGFLNEVEDVVLNTWLEYEVVGEEKKITEKGYTALQMLKFIKTTSPESGLLVKMLKVLELRYQESGELGQNKLKDIAGSILSLYADFLRERKEVVPEFIKEADVKYKLEMPNKFSKEELFTQEGNFLVNRILMPCIEGGSDNDGIMSCKDTVDHLVEKRGFIKSEKNGVTTLTKINGKVKVELIASVLKRATATADFKKMVDGKQIHTFMYRGHSTFVPEMTAALAESKITPNNLFLASCGGVSSISDFYKVVPGVTKVTATFGTGTVTVNTPAIAAFTNLVLEKGTTGFTSQDWKEKTKELVGGNRKFPGYQFPHENEAAVFVQFLTGLWKE